MIEGKSYFLGGQEAATQQHRPAHIYQQGGGRLREELCRMYFKVLSYELHRRAHAVTLERVAQGAVQIQVERIAELVRLGVVGALAATPANTERVLAKGIFL